jgi:hypothetical protein
MMQLRERIAKANVEEPVTVVTDRELALLNSLEVYFPNTTHILCRWHVNMNVLAKTKGYFPKPIKTGKKVYLYIIITIITYTQDPESIYVTQSLQTFSKPGTNSYFQRA